MDREDIKRNIKKNLRELVSVKGITQAKLGEILDVSGKATVSNYLNDNIESIPDITSLYKLKEYYGIPLDVLVSPNFNPSNSYEIEGTHMSEYDKFLGVYNLYYLTTNKISSISNRYNSDPQLAYGVLTIVKDSERSISKESYHALACFSMRSEDEVNEFKNTVLSIFDDGDYTSIRNLFTSRERYCEGGFELIQKGKFYSLSLTGYSKSNDTDCCSVNDKILMMGFNPDNTDTLPYIGGGMLTTSLSRGMKKAPCSQVVMISRNTVDDDSNEIINQLLRTYQRCSTDCISDCVMDRINTLYQNPNYSDEDREILIRSHINKCFVNELTNATSQLFYILEEEDQYFYHFLKNFK